MMCAYLLKNEQTESHGRLYLACERVFDRVLSWYRDSLTWVLARPIPVLIVLLLTIALNGVLIVEIPKGFFPVEDTGALAGAVQGPQEASFPEMDDSIRKIVGVIKNDPRLAVAVAQPIPARSMSR